MKSSAAKIAVRVVQWGALAAILGYLVYYLSSNDSFAKLSDEKHWDLLAAALGIMLVATTLTIVRWHWLILALDLPVSLRSALRLGFLGCLLNFLLLGFVGGDLFKSIFVARQLHGRRAEAVSTVVVDRLIGLFGVFLLATIAILATGAWRAETVEWVRSLYRTTFICTGIGGLGILGLLLLPDSAWHGIERRLARLPKIGLICERLIAAVRRYRRRAWVLGLALGVTVAAQSLFVVAFFLVSAGLLKNHPSLPTHMIIVPLATVTSIVPLPMMGLGLVEGASEVLYRNVPAAIEAAGTIPPSQGVGALVSLAYRLLTFAVALVGVCYYLAGRREIAEVIHEVEIEEKEGHSLLDADEEECSRHAPS